MIQEQEPKKDPRIYVKGGWIPAPTESVAINSHLWRKISIFLPEQQRNAERLSQETYSIASETAGKFLTTVFDISSEGLAIKLGVLFSLAESNQLSEASEEEDFSVLTRRIGSGNIMSHPLFRNVVRTEREDYVIPSWYYLHFVTNNRLKRAYETSLQIQHKMNDFRAMQKQGVMKTDFRKDLLPFAYEDLYWTYITCYEVINFLNTKFPGLIRSHFKPKRYSHLRNQNWNDSLLLQGLRERFSWPHVGQPTLKELLDASYQLLTEKMPPDFNEEMPTKIIF